jgi:hypothetical protein
LFIVAPIVGALAAGASYYFIVGGPGREALANAPVSEPRRP